MNDAARTRSQSDPVAGTSSNGDNQLPPTTAAEETNAGATTSTNVVEEKERLKKKQKMAFLDQLIRSIDIMVFCELSVLYYMDCSFIRFLIRAIPHWLYFTPKPDVFPPPLSLHRPYLGTIFFTNLICVFLHLVYVPPEAGEASHGYLHGGVLIDFVGQASPVSKVRLLGLDLLTLLLQVLIMAVTLEKYAVQGKRAQEGSNALTSALDALGDQLRRQDLDLEERGELGSAGANHGEDIEMSNLRPVARGRTGGEEDAERDELYPDGPAEDGRDQHPLDSFYTGEYVVARLPVLDIVRAQWRTSRIAANVEGLASASSGIQGASSLVGRRISFTFGGRTFTR